MSTLAQTAQYDVFNTSPKCSSRGKICDPANRNSSNLFSDQKTENEKPPRHRLLSPFMSSKRVWPPFKSFASMDVFSQEQRLGIAELIFYFNISCWLLESGESRLDKSNHGVTTIAGSLRYIAGRATKLLEHTHTRPGICYRSRARAFMPLTLEPTLSARIESFRT